MDHWIILLPTQACQDQTFKRRESHPTEVALDSIGLEVVHGVDNLTLLAQDPVQFVAQTFVALLLGRNQEVF